MSSIHIPKKPPEGKAIVWHEVKTNSVNFFEIYAWCSERFGPEYECWWIADKQRYGSNKGQWKTWTYRKDKNHNIFAFRDEKIRLEVELRFG